MSIGWEEGSGFLQSGMEPRGGTMGPGTAPHPPPPTSHQGPRAGGSRLLVVFPGPLCLVFGADGASRWVPAASPQLTFFWDSRI